MTGGEAWRDALAGLPVCPVRGLPIPVSSGRDDDGAGRFGVNDPLAKLACALGRRCGVCGQPLDGPVVFLALDRSADPACLNFGDPGMHESCAAASMVLCPYIAKARVPSRVRDEAGKPGWVWVAAAGYEVVPGPALVGFRPVGVLAIRRFTYGPTGLAETRKQENVMTDATEQIRRDMIASGQPAADLAADTDEKWTTAELQRDFEVLGYMAPYVAVKRRGDGQVGSLEFTASPRVYFAWRPHDG